jgi:tol-pal system protein YbgF
MTISKTLGIAIRMRDELKRYGFALPLAVLASACVTPSPEQDPMVQRMAEMDGRLLRIERILSNQSLLEQSQRVDSLLTEVRAMRGQIETVQHNQDSAKTQQRDLYGDIDKRLQAVEGRSAAVAVITGGASEDDAAAYKKAFDLLKDGKYAESSAAFTQFLTSYPQSSLIDNANYWQGEAYYVGKDFTAALRSFKAVVEKYPDSRKLPDAWLKIGYCQYELKNWKESRDALNRVMKIAPDTQAAKLAEQRLAKLKAEGH